VQLRTLRFTNLYPTFHILINNLFNTHNEVLWFTILTLHNYCPHHPD